MSRTAQTVVRRLVVELNRRSVADLQAQVDAEELTKTTIVNRAIQVYRLVMSHGGRLAVEKNDGTIEWIRIF